MFRSLHRLFPAIILSLVAFAGPAHAAKDPIYTPRFSNLALDGYDPVAYFQQGMPVKGSREWTTDYKGATWRFSSAANRDAFVADPEAFAPQYGGYCAWAAAEGYTARGNPAVWRIVDGKLYLQFNERIQRRWEKDIPGFIARADDNWPGILQ